MTAPMNQTAEARAAILKALAAAPEPSPQLCERIAARMAGPLLERLAAVRDTAPAGSPTVQSTQP